MEKSPPDNYKPRISVLAETASLAEHFSSRLVSYRIVSTCICTIFELCWTSQFSNYISAILLRYATRLQGQAKQLEVVRNPGSSTKPLR